MTPRQPRLHDPGFLAFLRQRPCCVCGKPPPSEACHIRYGLLAVGKSMPGLQAKPDDKWAVPMCCEHHREQHMMNEMSFWWRANRNPITIAQQLYTEYGGNGGRAKGPRKIRPRPPRELRKKIQSRGFR